MVFSMWRSWIRTWSCPHSSLVWHQWSAMASFLTFKYYWKKIMINLVYKNVLSKLMPQVEDSISSLIFYIYSAPGSLGEIPDSNWDSCHRSLVSTKEPPHLLIKKPIYIFMLWYDMIFYFFREFTPSQSYFFHETWQIGKIQGCFE